MGFSSSKRALLVALETGNFQHEPRGLLSEKNLLAVGDVSVEDVIGIVRRARGPDYSVSPHHWDPGTEVHVFRSTLHDVIWYVKAYFLDEPQGMAVVISIHR